MTRALRCYVAAPFEDAPLVRDVHARLVMLGMQPTSEWAETPAATGERENLRELTIHELAYLAGRNDGAVMTSDAVLVLARDGVGGEMFAEARLAYALGSALVWVGRTTLSAYRPDVVRVSSLDEAFLALSRIARTMASRGALR